MAEVGWASLGIVPTLDKGFDAKLSRGLDPALTRVGRDSGKRFGGFLGKAAVAGAAGVIGAGFAAFRFGQDALGEAREAQEISRTTAAILKATGGAAKLSRKEYDKLTESLMEKTAVDDEQIAQAGNLLLTFKNIKREGPGVADIFGRTLASALDLSAAGFGSSDSAAKMLGKALNDPVKGITALSRAGVTFSEDQKKAIESMVESNDLLGAQKLILKEVESQVGGTAEKQKTSAKELEVAWGNVKEEIGFALIPVMEDLADFMLDKGIPAAEDFSGWLKDEGIPQFKKLADKVEPLGRELLPAVGDALGVAKDALEVAAPLAADLVGAFNDMPDDVKKFLLLMAGGAVIGKKTGLLFGNGGLGGKGGLLSKANPVPVFVTNPGLGGPGGGKVPSFLSFGKILGPALAYVVAYEFQKKFPRLAPFGDEGFLPGAGGLPELFKGDSDSPYTGLGRSLASGLLDKGQALGSFEATANEKLLRPLLAAKGLIDDLPDNVITAFSTPGMVETTKDVRQLIRYYDLDLDKREVKTLIELLGVDKVVSDAERAKAALENLSRAMGVPIDPGTSSDGRSTHGGQQVGTGLSMNVGTLNVHDGKDLLRNVDQRRRRANTDNVRSAP